MRKIFLIIILLPLLANSQEISLDSCISAAKTNWPAFKKQLSIAKQAELINTTLNKNYLPKLNLSGQATYQSEVIAFPENPIPAVPSMFPELPLDNYNVEANFNQTIWDGGIIKSTKDIQLAANNIDVKKLNVETYGLIGKINQLYVNYLFLNQNEEILNISEKELDANIKSLNSAIENGVLLSSDIDNLKSEKLKLEKELLNTNSSKLQIISSLNIFTGIVLDTSAQFIEPSLVAKINPIRPEINLLDAQINYSQSNIAKYKTNRMPKLTAFGKVGYGRPGFDMFNTDMHSYYLVGAKISWNIWDWNMLKNQKQQIEINQNIIRDNKEVLTNQISIEQIQYQQDIDKYTKQIAIDTEIEKLKGNVYNLSKSKFENGTITSTEYLKIFNELKRARLSTKIDKLRLMQSKINYEYSLGE